MHCQSEHLLVWAVGVLHLVVHGPNVLIGEGTLVAGVGIALAIVAGFSQLFSP
jgi:hypothetical protein